MEQAPNDPNDLEDRLAEAYESLDPGLLDLCTVQLAAQNPEASPEEIKIAAVKAALLLEAASTFLASGDITSFTADMGIRVEDTVLDFSGELHETSDFDRGQNKRNAAKKAAQEEKEQ